MAELKLFDMGQTFRNARDSGYQRRQQSRLEQLTGQAWNAPQDQQAALHGQIAGIDPRVAQGLETRAQGQQDRQRQQAVEIARAWKSSANASPEQRQQFYQQFLLPRAQQYGLPLPQTYDPVMFDREADALIAMGVGGGTSAGMQEFEALTRGFSPEDQERARRIKAGLDPRAVTGSRKTGTITGADGRERPFVFDPANNTYQVFDGSGWRDMSPGEAQQVDSQPTAPTQGGPQGGLYNTPNGPVRIESNLTPEQWQLVQGDVANNGGSDQYQLPSRDLTPSQYYGTQPQQPTPQQAPQPQQLPPRYDYTNGGALLVGQSPAEQAGSTEAAKLEAQLRYAPLQAQQAAEAAALKDQATQSVERMPAAVRTMVGELEEKASTAEGIVRRMQAHRQKIQAGTLDFGPVANQAARMRNFAGQSNEQSRNYQLFMSDLEKMRNDSLRLNNGVQTEGDAQRAWNELFANLNDRQYVLEGLDRIDEINSRAAQLHRARAEEIRAEYPGSTGRSQGQQDTPQGGSQRASEIDSLLDMYR